MRPYGKCGKCRQRFKITEDIAVCQKCSLNGDRLEIRFALLVNENREFNDYLEKWYGESAGSDPRSSSSSSSI